MEDFKRLPIQIRLLVSWSITSLIIALILNINDFTFSNTALEELNQFLGVDNTIDELYKKNLFEGFAIPYLITSSALSLYVKKRLYISLDTIKQSHMNKIICRLIDAFYNFVCSSIVIFFITLLRDILDPLFPLEYDDAWDLLPDFFSKSDIHKYIFMAIGFVLFAATMLTISYITFLCLMRETKFIVYMYLIIFIKNHLPVSINSHLLMIPVSLLVDKIIDTIFFIFWYCAFKDEDDAREAVKKFG